MDHIVYVDAKSNEMEKILDETKKMIIRGTAGRKMPYGRVNVRDRLYFINNNGESIIKATAEVNDVFNSDKISKEEPTNLVRENQEKLQLTEQQFKRWAGKRYIVIISVENVESLDLFEIDRSDYGNMDDWLPFEDIKNVKK